MRPKFTMFAPDAADDAVLMLYQLDAKRAECAGTALADCPTTAGPDECVQQRGTCVLPAQYWYNAASLWLTQCDADGSSSALISLIQQVVVILGDPTPDFSPLLSNPANFRVLQQSGLVPVVICAVSAGDVNIITACNTQLTNAFSTLAAMLSCPGISVSDLTQLFSGVDGWFKCLDYSADECRANSHDCDYHPRSGQCGINVHAAAQDILAMSDELVAKQVVLDVRQERIKKPLEIIIVLAVHLIRCLC